MDLQTTAPAKPDASNHTDFDKFFDGSVKWVKGLFEDSIKNGDPFFPLVFIKETSGRKGILSIEPPSSPDASMADLVPLLKNVLKDRQAEQYVMVASAKQDAKPLDNDPENIKQTAALNLLEVIVFMAGDNNGQQISASYSRQDIDNGNQTIVESMARSYSPTGGDFSNLLDVKRTLN